MNAPPSPPAVSLPLTVFAMLGTQTVTVLLFMTVPVMATEIAPAFGVASKDIALFVSIVFVSAMFFSAASGSFIHRYGGIRANQLGMTLSACCLLLALGGSLPWLYLAAALVGLGYGPNTPSGSHVLARVTPPRARSLVFSLKQSGAPLGGLLAGLLVPAMVHTVGWRGAIVVSVLLALAGVVAIQPLRAALDDDRDAAAPIALASPWRAVTAVMRDLRLRRLLLVAFCLTATQATVMTFVVIYLVEVIGLEFKLAGALFAASQASGAALRVVMGWAADRLGARTILVVLGLGSALGLVVLAGLDGDSAFALVALVVVLGCALGFGWNGVFLAEIASNSGTVGIGAATGGSLFFLYGGLVAGPAAVSALASLSGGYTLPLCSVAALTAAASLNLLRPLPR
ncbi:MAG: MFS transporter [Gammaproteobacteria bacterium]|nr:MFS transporter [Gammaproteobacteria bacterium]